MAHRNQTNARRNNTQAGRRVVNFYNDGTVNIDSRQDRSRSHKIENNGCTINYPYHPAGNKIGDYFNHISHFAPEHPSEVAELPTQKGRSVEYTSETESYATLIRKAVAVVTLGLAVVLVIYRNRIK